MANLVIIDGGKNLQPVAATPDGDASLILIRSNEHRKPTFRYAGNFTPVATPTDAIIIKGSATKTLRIKYIRLTSAAATAAGTMPVTLIKRSTADSGGTGALTAVTAGQHDNNDAVPTGTVSIVGTGNFTTLGTVLGNLGQGRLFFQTAAGGPPDRLEWSFATRQDKAAILRGANDYLCINLGGAAVPTAGTIDFEIEIEEDNS
jgi:hypothetical protein